MQRQIMDKMADFRRFDADTAQELELNLLNICEQFERLDSPTGLILHLEAHGNDYQDKFNRLDDIGLFVGAKEEFFSWRRMQPYFSRLYAATAGKLTLVVSACWGLSGIAAISQSISMKQCAPFRHLVSPDTQVTSGELEDFYNCFYKVVFQNGDFKDVFKSYSTFSFTTIEKFLTDCVLVDENGERRKDIQIKLAEQFGLFRTSGFVDTDYKRYTRKFVYSYLMIDRFPDLRCDMDLRRISKKLGDADLLLETMMEDEWT